MRIGFVTTEYLTENDFSAGLSNYLHRVSKALVCLGHQVHLIVLSKIDGAEFDQDGIRIHRINIANDHFRQWFNRFTRHQLPETSRYLTFSLRAYQKLMQLHRQGSFDIVQFPDWEASGLVSSLVLPLPWVTRISSYRPVWYEKSGDKRDLDDYILGWLEWLQMRRSRYLYAPSHTLQRLLAQQANIHHVRVIPTPFHLEVTDWDFSIFNDYLKGKEYLLFFGRFQLHKGFHILAQALPQVFEQNPNCHAVFVGVDVRTVLARSMKEYACSLCSEYFERLTFIDQLPHHQLYPVIVGARLVVLPSLIDNLPNACLEAMALGKPVIGTIGTSFDEILLDGETGFLVQPENVDALAAKINTVWVRSDLVQLGQAAKGKVQEFSIERTVQDLLLSYYQEIIAKTSKLLY